jgi:hypothetical protein
MLIADGGHRLSLVEPGASSEHLVEPVCLGGARCFQAHAVVWTA